jgi:hypothetical protein
MFNSEQVDSILDNINLPQKHKFNIKGFVATLLRSHFGRALEQPFDMTEMKDWRG